ncbi:MAG: HD domain-containing protein, partial [Deltaproteobacteria bacterium]|nr:HD domain-containing protein [Deltaproteobacteria bacterium]
GLVAGIFSRPGVRDLFMIAPAAKAMHHPYLGGLLEHTLSLCVLGRFISTHYNGVNRDLLTAGLILHDIGKIYELSYSKSFDYTDEGRLLGHITMGIELVDSRIREMPGFPRDLAALIKHMLLSHHGYLEFGSPKRPKTLEAMLLYYLDDLDAKTNAIQSLIGVNGAAVGEKKGGAGRWTDYQRLLERYIYKGVYPAVGQEGKGEKAEERAAGWSAGEKTEDVIVPENVEDESDLFRKG